MQETWAKGQAAGEAFYNANPVASIDEMHKQVVTTYLQLTGMNTHPHDIVMYSLGFTYGYCELDCRAVITAGSKAE